MKQFLVLIFLPLLAGCLQQSVETRMSACPLDGIIKVSFSNGTAETKNGSLHWTFPANERTYMTCHYADGFTRRQLFPDTIRSCTVTSAENGEITDFRCQAKI